MVSGSGSQRQPVAARPRLLQRGLDRAKHRWVTRPTMAKVRPHDPALERLHGDGTDALDESLGGHAILVTSASKSLRRRLHPLPWMVLEQLLLDAVGSGDRPLVAQTSARQISADLGLEMAAVARALRSLRDTGFVTLVGEQGRGNRLGLFSYLLGEVPGLALVPPDRRLKVGSDSADQPSLAINWDAPS